MTLLDVIPDALDVHGYVQARPGAVGAAAPLDLPVGPVSWEPVMPAPGSTFSWVRPPAFSGWYEWQRPEDCPRAREDAKRLSSTLANLSRSDLESLYQELGGRGRPKRRELAPWIANEQLRRWWPWMVAG